MAEQCFHCGQKIDKDQILFDDKLFCCNGCQSVYEILNVHNLENFYNINKSSGVRPSNENNAQFDYLDTPEVFSKVVDFSEGGNIYSINEAKVYFRKSSFHITSMNDNIIEKQKAHLKSLKELILDYNNVMTFKQKKFFVQLFENQIFSFSKVGFQNYIYLVYFFCKFMSFGEIIILFKSFLLRIK